MKGVKRGRIGRTGLGGGGEVFDEGDRRHSEG